MPLCLCVCVCGWQGQGEEVLSAAVERGKRRRKNEIDLMAVRRRLSVGGGVASHT